MAGSYGPIKAWANCSGPSIYLGSCVSTQEKEVHKLIENGVFFGFKARVHVIEFQKRGCPHAHLTVWFELPQFTPDMIDGMISAEIPHTGHPTHDLVVKLMIHGPGGRLQPARSCMVDEGSTKNFLKDFNNGTEMGDDSYAVY